MWNVRIAGPKTKIWTRNLPPLWFYFRTSLWSSETSSQTIVFCFILQRMKMKSFAETVFLRVYSKLCLSFNHVLWKEFTKQWRKAKIKPESAKMAREMPNQLLPLGRWHPVPLKNVGRFSLFLYCQYLMTSIYKFYCAYKVTIEAETSNMYICIYIYCNMFAGSIFKMEVYYTQKLNTQLLITVHTLLGF
jgi:hypothetical protein